MQNNKLLDKKTVSLVFGAVPELLDLNRSLVRTRRRDGRRRSAPRAQLSAMTVEAKKPVDVQVLGDAFLKSEIGKRMAGASGGDGGATTAH